MKTDTKAALVTMAEVITFLFAAFNGHLTGAAPPASRIGGMRADYAVGIASFAALLIFLLVKALLSEKPSAQHRKIWLRIAAGLTVVYLIVAVSYGGSYNAHTFVWTPDSTTRTVELVGRDHTARGREMVANFRRDKGVEPLPGELLAYSESYDAAKIPALWTSASIVRAHNHLVYLYITMVVVLATAIASLLELTQSTPSRAPSSE
ncbi:MAG TPA: hypothetical protein VEQ60_02720 [Longimicrobium sp.]|nr:hypothetical protein [Longimicrobium sp.]